MAGELFKADEWHHIVHVPHEGFGRGTQRVIGGHVQMMFDAIYHHDAQRAGRAGEGASTTGAKTLRADARCADGGRRRVSPVMRPRSGWA